ncbi:MAG: class I SAM-dependent methyltransferase [Acidobacteria bacterium]|nr:class I SAM-dependent methyltransferase [Acidobacteriota bacterium]
MPEFNPLNHPACLQHPVRLAPSTWIEHVPFAMYLVDALRPRVFVELGVYHGVSYCAFCQAVAELGTGTECYGVDTWRGDPQNGFFGDELLEELRRHHDPLYCDFSRLVQSDFDSASGRFADGSVDLLHIDGFHTYEAVRKDFETWLPKMSRRGVVLFHDTHVREQDFGVWKLWDEVKAGYSGRHYEVSFGCGLGLVAVGDEYPEALRALFDSPPEELERIRGYFRQLGRNLETVRELRETAHELQSYKHAQELGAAAAAAYSERLRREHPLLIRASNFLHLCAERGWGGALRLAGEKIRG